MPLLPILGLLKNIELLNPIKEKRMSIEYLLSGHAKKRFNEQLNIKNHR